MVLFQAHPKLGIFNQNYFKVNYYIKPAIKYILTNMMEIQYPRIMQLLINLSKSTIVA